MRLKYRLTVDCPNCALKIEHNIRKLDKVEDCSASFLTQKLIVDVDKRTNTEKLLNQMRDVVKKIDSDCEILET